MAERDGTAAKAKFAELRHHVEDAARDLRSCVTDIEAMLTALGDRSPHKPLLASIRGRLLSASELMVAGAAGPAPELEDVTAAATAGRRGLPDALQVVANLSQVAAVILAIGPYTDRFAPNAEKADAALMVVIECVERVERSQAEDVQEKIDEFRRDLAAIGEALEALDAAVDPSLGPEARVNVVPTATDAISAGYHVARNRAVSDWPIPGLFLYQRNSHKGIRINQGDANKLQAKLASVASELRAELAALED